MRTLVDTILARCQALRLTQGDMEAVDASAVELMLLHVLRGLTDLYDWDEFIQSSELLFITQEGVRSYALPDDFQRFLMPKDRDTSGLLLYDGNTPALPMPYKPSEDFRRQWSVINGRPQSYTLGAGPVIVLDPPPDSNGGADYRGVGSYVRTITTEALEGNVPILLPSALVEMTVATMALDAQHAAYQFLAADAEKARTRLINAHGRTHQQFQLRTGRNPLSATMVR